MMQTFNSHEISPRPENSSKPPRKRCNKPRKPFTGLKPWKKCRKPNSHNCRKTLKRLKTRSQLKPKKSTSYESSFNPKLRSESNSSQTITRTSKRCKSKGRSTWLERDSSRRNSRRSLPICSPRQNRPYGSGKLRCVTSWRASIRAANSDTTRSFRKPMIW